MAESRRSIAHRRGFMAITVRERGNVPRGMKSAFNAASKDSWHETAEYFHEHLRDKRFTPEHAQKAGFSARKGQLQSPPSGYYAKKLRSPKHGGGEGKANPLWFSGDTRKAMRFANITSTSKGGRAAYSGASVFNYRHPKSRIRMNEEFRLITADEAIEMARVYDQHLDENLKLQDKG